MSGEQVELPQAIATLGEAIRYLRLQRGLSLRELARRVGISAPFLSDIERGRRTTEKLDAIASELGVDAEVLRSLDTRLSSRVREWAANTPGVTRLLEEFAEAGATAYQLRDALTRGDKRD